MSTRERGIHFRKTKEVRNYQNIADAKDILIDFAIQFDTPLMYIRPKVDFQNEILENINKIFHAAKHDPRYKNRPRQTDHHEWL